MPIDPESFPDDAAALQEIVRTLLLEHGELHAENDKLRLLVQRLTPHQFGGRSEQLSPTNSSLGSRTSSRPSPLTRLDRTPWPAPRASPARNL